MPGEPTIAFGRQHLCDPDFINKLQQETKKISAGASQPGYIERLSFEMKSATAPSTLRAAGSSRKAGAAERCTARSSPDGQGHAADTTNGRRVWIIGRACRFICGPGRIRKGLYSGGLDRDVAPGARSDRQAGPHKEAFLDWVNWAVNQLEKRKVPIRLRRLPAPGFPPPGRRRSPQGHCCRGGHTRH